MVPVKIVGERKAVIRLQPAVVGMAAFVGGPFDFHGICSVAMFFTL
jgi:hypothetical protein